VGKANNVARSLIIASKLQGWDPTKIEGENFANGAYPEDRTTEGDTAYLHGPLPPSPESKTPDPGVPGPDNRTPGSGGRSSGKHNPYGGGKSEAGA
jgi:hypothetical protein